jgi:transcriptional regulator with XRE-family HTH domain
MLTLKYYDCSMAKSYGKWIFEKYNAFEREKGRKVSQSQFAKVIGVHQATLSSWMNETRKPSGEAALKLAAQFDDYEILDILGYSVPDLPPEESSLPPALKESFDKALDEIEREYKVRGITDLSSEEALTIAKEILEEHGWSVTT